MKRLSSNPTLTKSICLMLALSLVSSISCTATDKAPLRQTIGYSTAAESIPAGNDHGDRSNWPVAENYSKDETVYVNLDPQGSAYNQIVVNWLHSDTPNVTVSDRTTLDDVLNVKGDEQPQRDGDTLVWKMDGNDIFYRGNSSGTLPVDVKITYKLDGVQMSPEEMAGKSGKMEMTVQFKNNLKRTVRIGDQPVDLYVPLMATAALTLPDGTFSNVAASDGTIQTDGNNQAVALVSMPGLNESLNLKSYDLPGIKADDMDFPEEFTVTADVNEFSMGPIAIVATTQIPELESLDAADDIDDMRANLNDLRNAQNDLTAWDPANRTRSLFTDPPHTEGARTLVNDIFDFYDQDTNLLNLLPKYVTDENINLYDRVQDDMDDIDIDAMLHSDALDNMIHQLTDQNISRIRNLLDDYYDIKRLDNDELTDLLDETADLLDEVQRNRDSLDTFRILLSHSDELISLMDTIDDPTMKEFLKAEILDTAIDGIGQKQAEATLKEKGMPSIQELNSAITALGQTQSLTDGQYRTLNTALELARQQGTSSSKIDLLEGFLKDYEANRQKIDAMINGGSSLPDTSIDAAFSVPDTQPPSSLPDSQPDTDSKKEPADNASDKAADSDEASEAGKPSDDTAENSSADSKEPETDSSQASDKAEPTEPQPDSASGNGSDPSSEPSTVNLEVKLNEYQSSLDGSDSPSDSIGDAAPSSAGDCSDSVSDAEQTGEESNSSGDQDGSHDSGNDNASDSADSSDTSDPSDSSNSSDSANASTEPDQKPADTADQDSSGNQNDGSVQDGLPAPDSDQTDNSTQPDQTENSNHNTEQIEAAMKDSNSDIDTINKLNETIAKLRATLKEAQQQQQAAMRGLSGFETGRRGVIQVAEGVRDSIQNTVDQSVSSQTAPIKQKVHGMLNDVNHLQTSLDRDFGSSEIARKRIRNAVAFSEDMIPQLEKLLDHFDDQLDLMDDEDKDAQELLRDTKDMIQHLRDNENNIEALDRLLDEKDTLDFETLREKWPTLKQDLLDAKPILDDLKDDLDAPEMDASLHSSPETMDVLLQMKDDLYSNREISEILRDSLAEDKVQTATRMFSTFDKLQSKGVADKYVGQVDDVQTLLDRKDAIVDLSKEYRVYTAASDTADTSLKFIMKTDEVKKPEAPAPIVEDTQENQGILDKVKGFLKKITGN